MGSFYTNFALCGVTQPSVAAALTGRSAIVTTSVNGIVVVFDEASDSQDTDVINSLGVELSNKCGCPVLATMNHDDDVLWCALFIRGEMADEYNSCPAYFDDSVESDEPAGGDATKFVVAFPAADPTAVEKVLRASDDTYTFAAERHAALAAALALPPFVVGGGYGYISDGDFPDGLSEEQIVRTS